MTRKNIIYTLTTSLVLGLGSCTSEDMGGSFDRTADGAIDFTTGVESSPNRRAATRAVIPTYYGMKENTQIRLKVDGTWAGKEPEAISQITTCKTNEATADVNTLSFTESEILYWDDYGTGDPNNSTNTSNGVNVLAVAVDGLTEAPSVGNDQWESLPWTVITDGKDEANKVYVTHPNTGVKIKDFQIPEWKKS